MKSEIEALHETRNNAQHKAVIPSISSIERFLIYSSDFLRESYMLCFNLSFDEMYLTDAIMNAEIRKIMRQAEECMQKKESENSVENSAWAFAVLLREKQKYEGWRKKIDPFFQFKLDDICRGLAFQDKHCAEPRLKEMFESIISEIEYLNNMLDILSLGANIREYLFFKKNAPGVNLAMDGTPHFWTFGAIDYNVAKCSRIFNFVYNLILSWESGR